MMILDEDVKRPQAVVQRDRRWRTDLCIETENHGSEDLCMSEA